MSEHFVIATYARDCVIAGDVEALRQPLMQLAEYRYETVAPGAWLQGAAELQAAARLTAQADSLEAAALGVAMMGRICGDCHTEQGSGPRLGALAGDLSYGKEADTLQGRMHRHARGADQLWLGLTAPSNVVWEAGAKTIGDTPPLTDADYPSDFMDALAEVRALGAQASQATTSSERAMRYGALLGTCADCHSRLLDHEAE